MRQLHFSSAVDLRVGLSIGLSRGKSGTCHSDRCKNCVASTVATDADSVCRSESVLGSYCFVTPKG